MVATAPIIADRIARVVEAAHRQPRRDGNDAIPVEDARNQGDREQRDRGERELPGDPPEVDVGLRTELGRAPFIHEEVNASQFLALAGERTSPMPAAEILWLLEAQFVGYRRRTVICG